MTFQELFSEVRSAIHNHSTFEARQIELENHELEQLKEYTKQNDYKCYLLDGIFYTSPVHVWNLVPTHCVCCNRPLTDSTSINLGIGPVCRKKYRYEDAPEMTQEMVSVLQEEVDFGADFGEAIRKRDSRAAANSLCRQVAILAHKKRDNAKQVKAVGYLRLMGFDVLADKIVKRIASHIEIECKEDKLYIKTPFSDQWLAAVRRVSGARWDKDSKRWMVPTSQKKSLWAAMKAQFKGEVAQGPKGLFIVA